MLVDKTLHKARDIIDQAGGPGRGLTAWNNLEFNAGARPQGSIFECFRGRTDLNDNDIWYVAWARGLPSLGEAYFLIQRHCLALVPHAVVVS